MSKTKTKTKKKTTNSNSVKRVVKDLIPIREYIPELGVFVCEDGTVMNTFMLNPRDIPRMPDEDVVRDIKGLSDFLMSYDYHIKLIGMNFPIDVTKQINRNKVLFETEDDPNKKQLLDERIETFRNIESYLPQKNVYLQTFSKNEREYKETINALDRTLGFGNQISTIKPKEQLQVYSKLSNMNTSVSDQIEPDTSILQTIQPQGNINFRDEKYISTGDGFVACLTVYEYPEAVGLAWMQHLSVLDNVVYTVDIGDEKQKKAQKNLAKSIKEYADRYNKAVDAGNVEKQAEAARELNQTEVMFHQIESKEDTIRSTHTRIFVWARSKKRLEERITDVSNELDQKGIKTVIYSNETLYDYKSLFLSAKEQKYLPNSKTGIPITSVTLGMGFPMYFTQLIDDNGFYLGRTITGGPVIPDTYAVNDTRKSHDMLFCGKMGTGKSVTVKSFTKNNGLDKKYIRGLVPSKEYDNLIKKLGGFIINLDGSNNSIINDLQAQKVADSEEACFAAMVSRLALEYKCVHPTADAVEIGEYENLIRKLYINKGFIKEEKESEQLVRRIYNVTKHDPKDYPIYSDLQYLIEKELYSDVAMQIRHGHIAPERAARLEAILTIVKKFSITYGRIFNAHTNMKDISSEPTVFFNLGSLLQGDRGILAAKVMSVATLISTEAHHLQQEMTERYDSMSQSEKATQGKNLRKYMFIMDEFAQYSTVGNGAFLDVLDILQRNARKLGAQLVYVVHNMQDCFPKDLDKDISHKLHNIFSKVQYKFIFEQDSSSLPYLRELFGSGEGKVLKDNEIERSVTFKKGECYFILSPSQIYEMKVDLSPSDAQLFGGGE